MNILRRSTAVRAVAVVFALVTVAACSEDTKVGSEALTEFEEQAQERLGDVTTTTAQAATETTAPVTTAVQEAVTTSTAAAPSTTQAAAPSITVKIQGDAQGNAFEPSNQRVYVGSKVKFLNTDTVAHTVTARRGEWASPSIPPGGEWVYEANAVGLYEYTDERPYAVGYLEVLAR